MQRLRTTVQFEVGWFVTQLLERFKDFFAVRLFFFDFLMFRARLGRWIRLFFRSGCDGVFVPQVVEQRDFEFSSDHLVSPETLYGCINFPFATYVITSAVV